MARNWREGLPQPTVVVPEDALFYIEGRDLRKIGAVMQALYLERRRSGDEQRDMAQMLQSVIDGVSPY